MRALLEVLAGLALFVWDHPHLLRDLLAPAPTGRTLRERYPPARVRRDVGTGRVVD